MKMRILLAAVCMAAVSGCAPNVSPNSYSVGSVGQVNRTVAGVVISARSVQINGTTGAGGATGAALGATAGSGVGGGGRGSLAAGIVGAVAGAAVGAAAEQSATQQMGMEYVVQTENGNMMTIVQGLSPAFSTNDRVLVLYGSPARVIADPRQPTGNIK